MFVLLSCYKHKYNRKDVEIYDLKAKNYINSEYSCVLECGRVKSDLKRANTSYRWVWTGSLASFPHGFTYIQYNEVRYGVQHL